MNKHLGLLIVTGVAVALLLPLIAQAGSKSRAMTEDVALKLLLRTLEHDNVYAKRISLDCVTFETEETTRIYFEFALREKHNKKCAGDPDTNPVIDRYRVNRASGKIEWYDATEDNWQSYDAAKVR
jgi:hypothetical protein